MGKKVKCQQVAPSPYETRHPRKVIIFIAKNPPTKTSAANTIGCNLFLFFFLFICDHIAIKRILTPQLRLEKVKLMAERVGFEPTVPLTVHKLSKPAPIF